MAPPATWAARPVRGPGALFRWRRGSGSPNGKGTGRTVGSGAGAAGAGTSRAIAPGASQEKSEGLGNVGGHPLPRQASEPHGVAHEKTDGIEFITRGASGRVAADVECRIVVCCVHHVV